MRFCCFVTAIFMGKMAIKLRRPPRISPHLSPTHRPCVIYFVGGYFPTNGVLLFSFLALATLFALKIETVQYLLANSPRFKFSQF